MNKVNELIKKYENLTNFWISVLSRQLETDRKPSDKFYVNPEVATLNITNFKNFKRDLEELIKDE
jgi:hypothetical protein